MRDGDERSWFQCAGRDPAVALRLFCLPFAGAGASMYRTWGGAMPAGVEVHAVQLPGHETRMAEPQERSAHVLAGKIVEALDAYTEIPMALFGYSLGALLAFEVARELRRRRRPAPACLLVAAMRAPHVRAVHPPLGRLPTEQLVESVNHYYEPSDAAWAVPEFRDALLPVLREDMLIADDYRYVEEPPLKCPIHAYCGLSDRSVPVAAAESWREQTSAAFSLDLLPGGHFFLNASPGALQQRVAARLSALLRPPPVLV